MISKLFSAIKNFDVEALIAGMDSIADNRNRTLFISLVALNIVTYFMFIAHHMLHNHGPRFPWIPETDQIFAGRWFNYFLLKLNYTADIPVLLPLFGISVGIVSGLIAIHAWRFNNSTTERFLVVGLLTTFPATLSYFYYTYQTPLFFIGSLFAVAAVVACQRISFASIGLSLILTMLALASYQPALSILATIIISLLIADLLHDPAELKTGTVRRSLTLAACRMLAIGLGGIAYRLSLPLWKINTSHATSTLELGEMPARFVEVAAASVKHLWLTQPELLSPVKAVLCFLLALSVLSSLYYSRKSWLRIVLLIVLWASLVISTKAMFLISTDNSFYQYRYNGSLAYLHAFSLAVLFHTTSLKALRSSTIFIAIFLVARFVQADLVRQEVLYRGEMHDIAIANRILTRIENLQELDTTKVYDLVRIGKYSTFRGDWLRSQGHSSDVIGDSHMDNGEIADSWTDESIFVLLGAKIKFKYSNYDPGFQQKVSRARETLLSERKPWPHASSVFIKNDVIYIYMQ